MQPSTILPSAKRAAGVRADGVHRVDRVALADDDERLCARLGGRRRVLRNVREVELRSSSTLSPKRHA